MAIPQGNYTAYQQTTSDSKLEFGQMAKDVAQSEKDRRDKGTKLAKERQEQQQKIALNFNQDYSSLADVITGTETIDEAFARGIGKARDMMGDIYKQIQTNPSLANDVKTQMKLQNLRNYAKTLKTSSDRITDFNAKLATGMQDGTLSNWNQQHLNIADSIYRKSNLDISVDSMGRAIGATVQVDDDGEVVLDENGVPVVEQLSLPQVMQGGGLPTLIPEYNMAADAQAIGKDLGKRVKALDLGGFAQGEYQTFDFVESDARELVKGYIGNASSPTDMAKSIWADILGNAPKKLTESDMKVIEDAYVKTIKPFYDESTSELTDLGARNAALERQRREKEDAKKAQETKASSQFTIITDQDGRVEEEEFVGATGDIQGKAVSFALPTDPKTKESNTTVTGPNGNKMTVTEVHLLDSGELAYSGFELRGKVTGQPLDPNSSSIRNRDTGKLSSDVVRKKVGGGMDKDDKVLTSVAKAYGLDNEAQLKQMLEGKKESYAPPVRTAPDKKQISSSQVSAAAKKAGYSESEYRKLLEKNGVQIIN
jgi:hypothetical protein